MQQKLYRAKTPTLSWETDFVVNNNNVAWKNVTFIEGENNSGVIGIYNPFKELNKFSLTLFKQKGRTKQRPPFLFYTPHY